MENLPINIVDVILLVLALLSGLLATMRGFVREVLSIGAWLGAGAAATYGYDPLRPHVAKLVDMPLLVDIITGGGLFLITLVGLSLLSHSVSKGIKESAVGALDRSLGFLFGVARVIFLASVLHYGSLYLYQDSKLPDMVTQSRSFPYIELVTRNVLSLLPERFRSVLEKSGNDIRDQIDAVNETKRQVDRLNNLLPQGDQDNNQQPAYDEEQRSNLEDLIEDNQ